MQTITFYAPTTGDAYIERADQRVTVIDKDEVTLTSRVEFRDGLRAVVRSEALLTRKA